MVSLSDGALSIGDAASYYENHYSTVGEYYAPDQSPIIGQASGRAAAALGLEGSITAEQFEALLRGQDPASGAALRAKPTHGEVERAGWDVTLSPPKSVSIQALVAGDSRLIEADRQAAMRAIQEAERCALARRRGGKQWVQTANIAAVMFEHHDARESLTGAHGPMPQLHHHTFIMNLTQLANGQWRSLDPGQIYKARGFIDAVYMSELARRVQEIGYRIERRPDGGFELAGFTREQIEGFSERRRDIQALMARNGIADPRSTAARKIGALGRKAKGQHDPAVLQAEREALAAEHGISLDHYPVKPARDFTDGAKVEAQRAVDFAIRHATSREAVIDYRDLAATALKHGLGATDLDHVGAQLDIRQQTRQLLAAGKSHLHPLDQYTTPEMVRLEVDNLKLVREGMNAGRPVVGIAIRSAVDHRLSSTGAAEVKEWAAAKGLPDELAEAAVLTLTTPHWASAIEGFAGTAKTTLVGAAREFAEQHGWTVRGFGMSTTSVQVLNQAGIQSQTIARTLMTPLPEKTGRELWVIDESSFLASAETNRLLKYARARGVERLVFVGDQRQHVGIEAGAPIKQFLAGEMAAAHLTIIRRQSDPELKRAVKLGAAGRVGEAVDLLIAQGRVTAIADIPTRYQRIADAYVDAHERRERCLVVSPGNDERRALNQAIQGRLIERGHVVREGRAHEILISRDMTPAQLQHAPSYHEGDVLYFTRGSKKQQIPKGYMRVATVSDTHLILRAENGRQINFDPAAWRGIRAFTPETRTIAVGDHVEWRQPDNRRRIANHQQAVITGLTANKIEFTLNRGRVVAMPLAEARHFDLGYASTSHAAQGAAIDHVIINIDSSRSPDLVNQRQFYVSLSRARTDARIYTDSEQGLRRAVSRTQEKSLALDAIQTAQRGQPFAQSVRI